MKRILLKPKDKSVIMKIKQFGEVEVVSSVFNIYAMNIEETLLEELKKIDDVVIENEEYFEVQTQFA